MYKNELTVMKKSLKKAKKVLRKIKKVNKIEKGDIDMVTEADIMIEKVIKDTILKHFPNDLILGEEFGFNNSDSKRFWTIDPIDGTFNYAEKIPLFGIQVSFIFDGDVKVSIIDLIELNECYISVKGQGAKLNGETITVDKNKLPERSMLSFGDYQHGQAENAKMQHDILGKIYFDYSKVRQFGSSAVDFSFLATSRTISMVALVNNIWDIAPGLLLLEESGAYITDPFGQPYKLGTLGLVASVNEKENQKIVKHFLEYKNKKEV